MSTNVLLDCHHARTGISVGRSLKLIFSTFHSQISLNPFQSRDLEQNARIRLDHMNALV